MSDVCKVVFYRDSNSGRCYFTLPQPKDIAFDDEHEVHDKAGLLDEKKKYIKDNFAHCVRGTSQEITVETLRKCYEDECLDFAYSKDSQDYKNGLIPKQRLQHLQQHGFNPWSDVLVRIMIPQKEFDAIVKKLNDGKKCIYKMMFEYPKLD